MTEVRIRFPARPYQQKVIDWFREGKRRACEVWHRKAGKDRTATFIESELCFKRVGLYWHALPKYEDARKVVWDAITPEGERLIEVNFPREVIRRRLDHEMKIELVNGSIWQPVGADNYDSLVGALPVHVTWSEYALMSPQARNFIRPALASSNGTELVITTARGYNHAFDLYEYARASTDWHCSFLTVEDTGVLSPETLAEERRAMPEELFRQEYYCDWSAANVGSILGRYVEEADKQGRITEDVDYDPEGAPLEISSDIGRRHISAWWFWQPQVGGFNLIDYDEDSGLDAGEWIERLKQKLADRVLARVWLPHDAKAKTFAARHSPVERFIQAFGEDKVRISPQTKKEHSINAGQVVLRSCRFHRTRCASGLAALRSWSYRYDDERKAYSRQPVDDWACDAADAFCEGAKMMQERVIEVKKDEPLRGLMVGVPSVTLEEMWASRPSRERRI